MVQSYSPGDGDVSSHEGILAPPGKYDWTCASFSPLESTTQTANRSVQPFLHSSRQKVPMPILYNGSLSTRIAPPWGIWTPFNAWCLGPMRAHISNCTSIGSAVFAQMTAECPYTLQWFTRFPFKIAPSHGGIRTPCNTWFLGPTRVLNPNGNSIASAVLQGLLVW